MIKFLVKVSADGLKDTDTDGNGSQEEQNGEMQAKVESFPKHKSFGTDVFFRSEAIEENAVQQDHDDNG